MCELCLPSISRRRALGLLGAATAGALLGRPDPAAAARAFQTGYGVVVEPRATWAGDDRPAREVMADEDVRFLLVHHTAGPSDGDPIDLMRQVYDFHTGPERGWPDVAYNFFVEPGGRVFEARAGSLQRAVEASATGGNQGFAQLVCLLGDFTDRNPTDAQLRSLNGTLSWLADRYGLDTSAGSTAAFTSRGSNKWAAGSGVVADVISGHREMSATACPGDTFFPYLKARVQAEVQTLRGVSASTDDLVIEDPAPPSTVTPQPTTTVSPTASAPATTEATSTVPTSIGPASTVPTSIGPASTVPPSVADGPVASPPDRHVTESAVDAVDPAASATGQSSSSATAWGLGVGAVAVIGVTAAYVGVREKTPGTTGAAVGDSSVDHHRL